MKVKDGFLLRQVAGAWMAVPVGERLAQVRGLISLNETGASIWRLLEEGCRTEEELVSALRPVVGWTPSPDLPLFQDTTFEPIYQDTEEPGLLRWRWTR